MPAQDRWGTIDFYTRLNANPGMTPEEIQQAYDRTVSVLGDDAGLRLARDVLTNPMARALYHDGQVDKAIAAVRRAQAAAAAEQEARAPNAEAPAGRASDPPEQEAEAEAASDPPTDDEERELMAEAQAEELTAGA